jgi:hypothetical protein
VPGVSGAAALGVGTETDVVSACGTGRRRLRMDDAAVAAEMGSVTTLCLGGVAVGRFGGEGGGECWYVVELLYVVHEKRLVGACLSLGGVWSIDFLAIGSCGGVVIRWGAGISFAKACSWITVSADSVDVLWVGVRGLG